MRPEGGARRLLLALGVSALGLNACTHETRREALAHGRFERVELSVPDAARSTVLLLSGAGDRAQAEALSTRLTKEGALIAGVDADAFERLLDQTSGCVFPAGDLDNLARFVQAYARLPSYQPAILLGLGAGASLAAAALEQAPATTFAGAIVFDYCGEPASRAPLCPRAQPTSELPPLVRLASEGAACPPTMPGPFAQPSADAARLTDELARLTARAQQHAVAAPRAVGDLPVIEIRASGGTSDTFGVFLSGDGGWAGFDEKLSQSLTARGIPIIGFDSLRYFWRARTPDGTAADIQHLVEHYRAAWKRDKVLLIGFSQGADVLPFVLNRLAPRTRAAISSAVALSTSSKASFEFHVSNWLGSSGDVPTLPEMQRLGRERIVYVCGSRDGDAICPQLDPSAFHVVTLPGDHHFDDAYDELSDVILGTLMP